MSMTLDQALLGVELESGRTYRCRVGDVRVELRVFPAEEPFDLTADTMFDPWTELPRPQPVKRGHVRQGILPPPDVPIMPVEDDHE